MGITGARKNIVEANTTNKIAICTVTIAIPDGSLDYRNIGFAGRTG